MTVAVLLFAVNVGGAKVGMAELRSALSEAGHSGVRTYLGTGNVLVEAADAEQAAIAVAEGIREAMGVEVRTVGRTAAQLRAALDAQPFGAAVDPARTVVVFLDGTPAVGAIDAFDADRYAPDRLAVSGGEAYVHYPNGIGRSALTMRVIDRALGTRGTARNLNTVAALIALAEEGAVATGP